MTRLVAWAAQERRQFQRRVQYWDSLRDLEPDRHKSIPGAEAIVLGLDDFRSSSDSDDAGDLPQRELVHLCAKVPLPGPEMRSQEEYLSPHSSQPRQRGSQYFRIGGQ